MIRLVLIVIFVVLIAGCYESKFELHPSSRLPSWLNLPEHVERKDVRVVMTFQRPGEVEFDVYVEPSLMPNISADGRKSWHPISVQRGVNTYPNWSIIEVDGISDVYEQRKLEPFLYIVDDKKLTSKLTLKEVGIKEDGGNFSDP